MKNIPKIKINYLTYLIIVLFLFSGFKNKLIFIFITFIIHEIGHAFFCFIFHVKIKKIELLPFGGLITIEKHINYPLFKDLLIASGGLLFQLIFGMINYIFINNADISKYNFIIFLINIIPIIPLDGSKIVFIIISSIVSYYYSLIINIFVSVFTTIILIFCYFICLDGINYAFLTFIIYYLFVEIKLFRTNYNNFLLERYINDFNFKNKKYFFKSNLKLLVKNIEGIFYVNGIKNEKQIIGKKFDISTYF